MYLNYVVTKNPKKTFRQQKTSDKIKGLPKQSGKNRAHMYEFGKGVPIVGGEVSLTCVPEKYLEQGIYC